MTKIKRTISLFLSLLLIISGSYLTSVIASADTTSASDSIGDYDTTFALADDTSAYGSYVSSSTYATDIAAPRFGDVNMDSIRNAKDVLLYRRSLVSLTTLGDDASELADINCDGAVNAVDLLILRKYIVSSIDIDDVYGIPAFNVDRLSIADINVSGYEIVIPDSYNSSDTNIRYSADLLKSYISYACGITLNVVSESAKSASHMIYIAYDPTSSIDGSIDEVPGDLGTEGFEIKIENSDVYIYGGTLRGCMYGAYEFLESYVGYRFMDTENVYLYNGRTVELKSGTDDTQIPEAENRGVCGYFVSTSSSTKAEKFQAARKINDRQCGASALNSKKYGYTFGRQFLNAHSLNYYLGMYELTNDDVTTHTSAEMYDAGYITETQRGALDSGTMKYSDLPMNTIANICNNVYESVSAKQVCFSSEKIYNECYQGMLKTAEYASTWKGTLYPELYQLSFSISDNTSNFCTCEKCRKTYIEEGGIAGALVRFVNRAATDIQKVYPGIKLFCILYTHEFPKYARPNENTVFIYCGSQCSTHALGTTDCNGGNNGYNTIPWTDGNIITADTDGENWTDKTKDVNGYAAGNNEPDNVYIPEWGAACENFYYWYYFGNFIYSLCPLSNTYVMKENIEYFSDNGCNGYYIEGSASEHMNFEGMNAYLAALLTWDPQMSDTEYDAHIREYLIAHYGDGWQYIYKYLQMLVESMEAGGCAITNNADPLKMYSLDYYKEHYEEMRDLLNTAYMLAEDDSTRTLIYEMRVWVDFYGLTATFNTNGTTTEYQSRYSELINYLKTNSVNVGYSGGSIVENGLVTGTIDYTVNPMKLIYNIDV